MKSELNRNRNRKKTWLFLVPIILLSYFSVVAFSYQESWFFSWSGVRPGVKQWVEQIENNDSRFISEQHLYVAKNLYTQESERLLEYTHPEIRFIAAVSLILSDSTKALTLIEKVLSDSEMYLHWPTSCCYCSPKYPAEYIHDVLLRESMLRTYLSQQEIEHLNNLYMLEAELASTNDFNF